VPLTFVSRTLFGLNFNAGGADDQALPTMHMGYNRRVATRIQAPKAGEDLPSLIGQVSVHTSGIREVKDKGGPGDIFGDDKEHQHKLSDATHSPARARIRQYFAIGSAAENP